MPGIMSAGTSPLSREQSLIEESMHRLHQVINELEENLGIISMSNEKETSPSGKVERLAATISNLTSRIEVCANEARKL